MADISFTKPLENGQYLTKENYLKWQDEELEKIKEYVGVTRYTDGNFALATQLLQDMVFEENFEDFLTLKLINTSEIKE